MDSLAQAVTRMQFPEAVGMMEVRMGLHMGQLYAGVLGIKLPRYCMFGATQVRAHVQAPECLHECVSVRRAGQRAAPLVHVWRIAGARVLHVYMHQRVPERLGTSCPALACLVQQVLTCLRAQSHTRKCMTSTPA